MPGTIALPNANALTQDEWEPLTELRTLRRSREALANSSEWATPISETDAVVHHPLPFRYRFVLSRVCVRTGDKRGRWVRFVRI